MATERERGKTKGSGRARMLVAALIGAMLLNPPILEIFSGVPAMRPFGWPLVLFYINLIWLLLILLVVFPKLWQLLRQGRHARRRVAHKGRG